MVERLTLWLRLSWLCTFRALTLHFVFFSNLFVTPEEDDLPSLNVQKQLQHSWIRTSDRQ